MLITLGDPLWSQKLDLMIPLGPLQLRVFCDSMLRGVEVLLVEAYHVLCRVLVLTAGILQFFLLEILSKRKTLLTFLKLK